MDIGLFFSSSITADSLVSLLGQFLIDIIPFLLLVALGVLAWNVRMKFKHLLYLSKLKWVLLEVRIPKDIYKSPLAMELVLINALAQSHPSNWYDRLWLGKLGPWFSLEIVSLQGEIHFLLRTEERYRNLVETQIYAQYPEVEIAEVPDYTEFIAPYAKDGAWTMYGTEFALTKADPYPIKTYIDYGIDKPAKKDEPDPRVDPITPLIEHLGSLGAGEQAWVQILVQSAKKRYSKKDGKAGDWTDEGKDLIKELLESHKGGEGKSPEPMTKGKSDVINAIERSISKRGFDCGIRALYIAETESFTPGNIAGLVAAFKHYSSNDLNGFKPVNSTRFDFPWQDMFGTRLPKLKKKMFEAYKLRSYFYPPAVRKPFVLTSEELATIYHFPGKVSAVPALRRVDSKKSEAPSNLPIFHE